MKRMRTGKRVHMNVNVRTLCIFLIEHLVHELFTILPKLIGQKTKAGYLNLPKKLLD